MIAHAAARTTSPPERRLHVIQGSHQVDADPDVMMTTVLGSCVSVCLHDPATGVGGMNHFLLPEAPDGRAGDRRYGVHAMELLINGLLALGARRERLEAKAFGGARMASGMADIGGRNAAFVRRFLADENISLAGESLGGTAARRIQFWPSTGRVRQYLVKAQGPALDEREWVKPEPAREHGVLELFT